MAANSRIMIIMMATVLIVTGLVITVSDDSDAVDQTIDGIKYTLNDDHTATVTGCDGNPNAITIPSTVTFEEQEYKVTTIGRSAFMFNSTLKSVSFIEGNLTTVEAWAFGGSGITSMVLPDTVISVGDMAFYQCDSLTTLTLNEGLQFIGSRIIDRCPNLDSLSVPKSISSIEVDSLSNYSNLQMEITIESGSKFTLEDHVLYDLTDSGDAKIVAIIGVADKITIKNVTTIPDTDALTSNAMWAYSHVNTIIISEGVTYIGTSAFRGVNTLHEVRIPSTVTSIGLSAFSGDQNLEAVTFAEGSQLTSIGDSAFSATGLTSIDIPDGVTSIGNKAFYGCEELTEINLPDSLKSIGDSAFGRCFSLTSLSIPTGISTITSTMLSGCSNLNELILPDGCTVEAGALSDTGLTQVTVGNDTYYVTADGGITSECPTWLDSGIITNEDELREFARYVNSGESFDGRTISLVENRTYDISGDRWTPIGITYLSSDGYVDHPFSGTFNGNNATIYGMRMVSSVSYRGMDSGDYYAHGFFGGVVGGTVTNLKFEGFEIRAFGTSSQNDVTAVAVGAVLFDGEVSHITIGEGTVAGAARVAGVVGYIGGAKTTVTDGLADGPAYTEGADMGTITISHNVNNANISSSRSSVYGTVGGIIATTNIKGMSGGTYNITDNVNYGEIKGFYAAGILASDFSPTTKVNILNNTNYGHVENTVPNTSTLAVGIANTNDNSSPDCPLTISGNTNNGRVSSTRGSAAGITDSVYGITSIFNNINNGEISGNTCVGGIVTNLTGGTVTGCENHGDIILGIYGAKDPLSAGGIAGYVNGGTIEDGCVNTGTVSGPDPDSVEDDVAVGNIVGTVVSGTVENLSEGDIGALQMVGGKNCPVEFVDSDLDNLTVFAGHNRQDSGFWIYTLNLQNSTVGTIDMVGKAHTGLDFQVEGGSVDRIEAGFTDNDGNQTVMYLLLSETDVGTVDATDGDIRLYVATDSDATVDQIINDAAITIGLNGTNDGTDVVNIPNSGTITQAISGTAVYVNSVFQETDQSLPTHSTYSGTDDSVLSRFLSGGTPTGIMDSILPEGFEALQSSTTGDTVTLGDGVKVIVPSDGQVTITKSVKPNDAIVGTDGSSKLVIAAGGSYNGITNPETYVWLEDEARWDVVYVAKVVDSDGSETDFTTLQAAIDAADGKTVRLIHDVYEHVEIPSGRTIVLDLNGFTLTNCYNPQDKDVQDSDRYNTIYVGSGATLTISGSGMVDNVSHGRAALYNDVGGTVTLNGGTYTRSEETGSGAYQSGGNSFYNILNHGTMTINAGVEVRQDGHYSSLVENGWQSGSQNQNGTPSVMTIYGGTFSGGINTIKNDDYGQLTIHNGTFTNSTQGAVLNWNEATIYGGTFSTSAEDVGVILNGYLNDTMDKGTIIIEGGIFNGAIGIQKMGGSNSMGTVNVNGGNFNVGEMFDTLGETATGITVSGGSYTASFPDEYLADGFVLTGSEGNYTAEEGFTVTFVIDNVTVRVVGVPEGGRLTDVPELPSIPGYNYSWNADVTQPINGDTTFTSVRTIIVTASISVGADGTFAAGYQTLVDGVTPSYVWTLPDGSTVEGDSVAPESVGTYAVRVTVTSGTDTGTATASVVYRMPEVPSDPVPSYDLEHDNDSTTVSAGGSDTVIVTSGGEYQNVDIGIDFEGTTVEITGNVGQGSLIITAMPQSKEDVTDLVSQVAPGVDAAQNALGFDVTVDSKVSKYQMIIKVPIVTESGVYIGSALAYFTETDGSYTQVTSRVVYNSETDRSEIWIYTDHNTPYTVIPMSYSDVPVTEADPTIQPDDPTPFPPYNPGWDDDDVPVLPPNIVVNQNDGDDETVKIAACAAAAVAAAIIALILVAEYRKK